MRADKIKNLLLNTKITKTKISEMLNVDLDTIRRINVG